MARDIKLFETNQMYVDIYIDNELGFHSETFKMRRD